MNAKTKDLARRILIGIGVAVVVALFGWVLMQSAFSFLLSFWTIALVFVFGLMWLLWLRRFIPSKSLQEGVDALLGSTLVVLIVLKLLGSLVGNAFMFVGSNIEIFVGIGILVALFLVGVLRK